MDPVVCDSSHFGDLEESLARTLYWPWKQNRNWLSNQRSPTALDGTLRFWGGAEE